MRPLSRGFNASTLFPSLPLSSATVFDLLGYPALFERLRESGMSEFVDRVAPVCHAALDASGHADFPRWQAAIESLRTPPDCQLSLNQATITATSTSDSFYEFNEPLLREMMPWRKGSL